MVHINCDIGEKSVFSDKNHLDLQLLKKVNAVNIAVGGHAGTALTAMFWYEEALRYKKEVAIHPSYPDKENFGRKVMDITWGKLRKNLSRQRMVLSEVKRVKFHGALYHEAMTNKELAQNLLDWMIGEGIEEVLTMPNGYLAKLASVSRVRVILEGFLDRRYIANNGLLQLMSRSLPNSIISPEEAVVQVQSPILAECSTFCIHSDTPNVIKYIERLCSTGLL